MADSHGTYSHTSESRGGETSGSTSQAGDGGGFPAIISPSPGDRARLRPRWGQRQQQLEQPTLRLASAQVGFWGSPAPSASTGTALAQATCVSGPAGCPSRYRLFPLLNAATCGFVFSLEAFIITGGLQRSLRNGFISSRCHTINAKCYYQTQLIDTCRIGRGA